jgi:hypothetical protein
VNLSKVNLAREDVQIEFGQRPFILLGSAIDFLLEHLHYVIGSFALAMRAKRGSRPEFRHFLLQGGNLGAKRMTTKARVELSRAACEFCVTQTSSPFQIEQ